MGAIETADLLDRAAGHLNDARDCTGIDIEDVEAYHLIQGSVDDLGSIIKAFSESWENAWDGRDGLYGGESALGDAASVLTQAAAGEDATGINEVKEWEEAATESADKARKLMEAFEQARVALVAHLDQVSQEFEQLAEAARAVADAMWEASEHAETGADKAEEIAEKLRNAVA